jgi:small subunit ribosomal protein S11
MAEKKEQPKETETPAPEAAPEAVKEVPKPKQKGERTGMAYLFSSPNNTIVHITDLAGNTISRVTGGMITKHSRLKSNPTIAMFAAKKAAERARDLGFNSLYVRLKGKTGGMGVGPGAHAAVKTLDKAGFKIINILDATKVPRGGPKKKGGKRGRRV